jgi:EmrB/QacA subfamily drug resistance transporter
MNEVPPHDSRSSIASTDRKWFVLASVGIGTFMSALDASIVNTIQPIIRSELHSDIATVQWAITVYLLVTSVLLLSFGRLGDLRGHKAVYVSGFGIFIAASALCGLSPSAGALAAFRAIQAVGAAMIFASSPAILTMNFPDRQRGQALGLQATMTYLGLALGPALAGWLVQAFGWRSVFYINVPVGAAALAVGTLFIPAGRRRATAEPFDYFGAAVFMAGLFALLLALNRGHFWGWASPETLLVLAASPLLLTAFVLIELRTAHPMLDLSLFSRRVFSAAVGAATLNYVCMASIGFLMPYYLIDQRGLSAADAGMLLSGQPLVMAIAAPIAGTISDRLRSGMLSALGMLILSAGVMWLSLLGTDTSLVCVAAAMCITGLGTGIFISPNNSALMGAAPRGRQGIAAGMLATARNTGMALGVGLAGAVLTTVVAEGRGQTAADAARLGLFAVAVARGLHLAAAAAVLGMFVSLIRRPKAA